MIDKRNNIKKRVEVGIEVFNKLLENSGVENKVNPSEWKPTPAYPSCCFIEIWSDGTVYGIDGLNNATHDLFYKFFETEEEWEEILEEIKEIKKGVE